MRRLAAALSLFGVTISAPVLAGTTNLGTAETALVALDAAQKRMVAMADVDGLAALAAPGLAINAPTNRVLSRDQFLAMMRSGEIAAEAFDRTVEHVSIAGDIGIVMGREVFTPTAGSELGTMYGSRPLQRRYTNIYMLDHGRWKWLARHANVIPGRVAGARSTQTATPPYSPPTP